MKTKYFKQHVPPTLLLTLLSDLCVIFNNCYIVDMPTYYNGIHKGTIQQFMEDCKQYYKESKQIYATKELTYKTFLTVVRHICKINSIEYSHHIQYCHSTYQVVYNICIPPINEI
jgi:hypothetical protein